jgi:5'-methylthioadenosine/S-adenosylhomocysteine nucleosidase
MVALFAAEEAEVQALRTHLALEEKLDGPWNIYRDSSVILVESGVGKVAAAAAVSYTALRFSPSKSFWLGVAGALNPTFETLDLVVARDAVQYDVNITAFGRAPGELATGERFVSADPTLTNQLLASAKAMDLPIHLGRIASGDTFINGAQRAQEIHSIFGADALEMEGAAALWVAKRLGLPMALVRAITDQAGSQAPLDFTSFLQSASERLALLIKEVLHTKPSSV